MQRLMPIISILILFIPKESWSSDPYKDPILLSLTKRGQPCEPVTESSLVCDFGTVGCMTVLGYYNQSCEFTDHFLDLENFVRNNTNENEETHDRLLWKLFNIENEFNEHDRKLEQALNTAKLWKMQANDLEKKARTKRVADMPLIQRVSLETGTANDIVTTLKLIQRYYEDQPLQERKDLQLVLKARGLYNSEIDGVWGRNTKIAFTVYIAPQTDVSTASSLEELFSEMKKGFIIDNLWTQENYAEELRQIWSTESKARISSEISPNRIPRITLPKTKNDSNSEPFVKNMIINGESTTCIKVGFRWDCD